MPGRVEDVLGGQGFAAMRDGVHWLGAMPAVGLQGRVDATLPRWIQSQAEPGAGYSAKIESWASALVLELDHFRVAKHGSIILT
jgi:hypothetical protein